MPEGWPEEWLRSWPQELRETRTPGLSCIFILVDRYTRSSILELRKRFENDSSVEIHSEVIFPDDPFDREKGQNQRPEFSSVIQVDFFLSGHSIVFKTEKIHPDYQPEGYYLEVWSRNRHILWQFPLKCIHQSYTQWI